MGQPPEVFGYLILRQVIVAGQRVALIVILTGIKKAAQRGGIW
jgi:hypothetical protein